MRVKICGITNTGDALFAERSGADAIGVVISEESPRCISMEDAKEIFSALGPFTTTVIVTHTNSQDLLDEMAAVNPSAIQVSADVNRPEDYRGKMIRVAGADGKIREDCDAIIIDQSHGKGIPFDYEHAEKLMKSATKPVILAGGLNMSNVPAAISRLQPYAVDVCSGVEKSPRIKDPMKVLEFLKAAGKIPVVRKKEKISR